MSSLPPSPASHRLRRARVTSERGIVGALEPAAGVLGSPLTPAQIGQITRYLTLLAQWSRKARLTTVTRPREAARLHVLDSLLCLRAGVPHGASVLDVGSAAGHPRLPHKLTTNACAAPVLKDRPEEHTSELNAPTNLGCHLLPNKR